MSYIHVFGYLKQLWTLEEETSVALHDFRKKQPKKETIQVSLAETSQGRLTEAWKLQSRRTLKCQMKQKMEFQMDYKYHRKVLA